MRYMGALEENVADLENLCEKNDIFWRCRSDEHLLYKYMAEVGLLDKGDKYHIVSIIGGQSSGKSTILNAMFGTNFDMMDSALGRRQTTKGIWCAKAWGRK
jgi:hypothetical protein